MCTKHTQENRFQLFNIHIFFRSKLEGSVDQWMDYDSKYDGLSKWLKDTEARLRNEGNLKPDLQSKTDQLEVIQVLLLHYC